MANLDDVVDLIKAGDTEIIDKQEEANKTLASIDRNIMEFLGLQKKKRLDDLEDRREKKSRLGVGAGALAAGGAGLAAAGTLGKAATGEGLGLGALAQDLLKLYLGAKAIGLGFKGIRAGFNKVFGGNSDINARLKKLNADLDADLKSIDERLRAAEEDIKKRQADVAKAQDDLDKRKAKTVNRGADGRFEAEDPRTRAAEIEIKERQLREAQDAAAKAEAEKAQLEKARAEAEMRRAELEAVEQEKKKKKQLARIQEMEAADAARLSEQDARAKGAEKAQKQRLRIEEMAAQDAAKTAEADARAQGAEKTQRQRLRIEEMAEQDRLRKAEADARIKGAADPKTKLPTFMTEPGPGKIQQAGPKTRGRTRAGSAIRGAGKVAAVVAAPIDVAISTALGGGKQVEEDVSAGKQSTVNAVVASSVEDLVGGTIGLIDLAANLVNAGIDKLGQKVTGNESFTVGRSDLGTAAGDLARRGVEATGLGSETKIGGGTAAGLVAAKRALTMEDERQLESMIASTNIRIERYKKAYANQPEKLAERIAAEEARIQRFKDQIGAGKEFDTQLRTVYSDPGEKTAAIGEITDNIQSAATKSGGATVVAPSSSTKNDSRSFQTNVYQKGANNIDPSAYAVPGFGPR